MARLPRLLDPATPPGPAPRSSPTLWRAGCSCWIKTDPSPTTPNGRGSPNDAWTPQQAVDDEPVVDERLAPDDPRASDEYAASDDAAVLNDPSATDKSATNGDNTTHQSGDSEPPDGKAA